MTTGDTPSRARDLSIGMDFVVNRGSSLAYGCTIELMIDWLVEQSRRSSARSA